MDFSEYADGVGKVKVRARIEKVSGVQKLVISEIPYGTTTGSLIASIEAAVQKGKVSVSKISDYTSDHVEIELALSRGAEPDTVIDQLYANTDCEVAIGSNMVVIRNDRPVDLSIAEYLKEFSAPPEKADQGGAGPRDGSPGGPQALAHPGAHLHRKPRLQTPGKGGHGGGGAPGGLRRHEALLEAVRARHDG